MAQDINDPNFKQKCAQIWPDIANHTTIDRFHEKIAIHPKSIFLGYADVTLGVKTASGHVLQWKLRGIEVKSLNGKPHMDMPSERGADGNYYPSFFPKTAEDRVILNTLVFSDARVKQALENAANQVEAAASSPDTELGASVETGAGEPEAGSVGAQVDNPFQS